MPTGALGQLRRAIDADPEFRRRVAETAEPGLVDEIGWEWLRRDDGWEQRVSEMAAMADAASAQASADSAARRAERKREAAEQAAVRARTELVALQDRLDAATAQVTAERARAAAGRAEAETARSDLAGARVAARHANDRAEAARARLETVEEERDALAKRAAEAERQRDALLAERAERGGAGVSPAEVTELRDLATSARRLADRLADIVDVAPAERVPLAVPGSVARDQRKTAEFLLRAPGAVVIVDGYNVAKLGWADDDLAGQRSSCIALAETVTRRLGSEIVVVFDGAGVVGAHAGKRRTVKVLYSHPPEIADDVIRARAAATPLDRPVIVVTNDQQVRRDVQAVGSNLLTSEAFLQLR